MKIAVYDNLNSGGSKREAYEFVKQFVRAGHTVHLFQPTTTNTGFLSLGKIAHSCHKFELEMLPPVRRRRLPGLRKYINMVRFLINIQRYKATARRIAHAIDGGDYDFVFVHHDQIVQSPYLLRYLRTPSVYYCAEPQRAFYDPMISRPYQRPQTLLEAAQHRWYTPARALERWITKREDRRNVQYASSLVTNSHFSAESIYRAYGQRARVVYLGVDINRFRPLDIQTGGFVLSVGAVSAWKGYDFLVRALGAVPERCRPVLRIVGNSASVGERHFLEALAAECGVTLDIFVGVSDEELVSLYNRAAVFVYTPVLEPFGLAPVEAMACGTPVVAVKEGGVRESVLDEETGFLVERVPSKFAERLRTVLTNQDLRCELGKRARERVEQYWTWSKAYQRFESVICSSTELNCYE